MGESEQGSYRADFEARFSDFRWEKAVQRFARAGLLTVPCVGDMPDRDDSLFQSIIGYLEQNEVSQLCCMALEKNRKGRPWFADGSFLTDSPTRAGYGDMLHGALEHREPSIVAAVFPASLDFVIMCTPDEYHLLAGERAVLEQLGGASVEDQVEAFRVSMDTWYESCDDPAWMREAFPTLPVVYKEAKDALLKSRGLLHQEVRSRRSPPRMET